ncbi:hypothetical protein H5411_35645 [Amycolatopsis echigonensis]|uniref:Transcriptional regulator n=1 Tax=Amycolatopsis echigonensis TaxID=2576905 RepID=A0A8E2B8J3_9PSEU|nr:hypothetical protein [Amycolatopsis echigonensis]
MSRLLYQLKAEFFKTLGHPARTRVLELLTQREHAVAELLAVAREVLTGVLARQADLRAEHAA